MQCEHCLNPLKKNAKKYCSNRCARKDHPRKWTDAELNYIEKIAGKYPPTIAVDKFLERAKKWGWLTRKREDIAYKMRGAGLSVHPYYAETHFSKYGLAKNLEVPVGRIYKLIELGLPATSKGRITTKSATDWLHWNKNIYAAKPYLSGANEEFLSWWLGDLLVRRIRTAPQALTRPLKKPIAVWNPTTGQIWETATAASKDLHISDTTIRASILAGKTEVCGIPLARHAPTVHTHH